MIHDKVVGEDESETGLLLTYYTGWGWGTFCDDTIDSSVDARVNFMNVVARELDYDYCTAHTSTSTGEFATFVDGEWSCTGDESSFSECSVTDWMTNDCSHGEDVYVTCYH